MYELELIEKTPDKVTSVRPHEHPMWELFYVRIGTGVYHNDGKDYPFSPGDIFITRPEEQHYERSAQGYGNYYLFFREFYLPASKPFYQLHDMETQPLLALLQLLYHASHTETSYLLHSALLESVHQYVRMLLPDVSQNQYVDILRQEINENFSNPAYTPMVQTEQRPFCADHFRKLFVKTVGTTPLQYLISQRINHAKLLINDRQHLQLSMKEIAFASGYSDYYYFSRQFKHQTGFSPREWARLSPYNAHGSEETEE